MLRDTHPRSAWHKSQINDAGCVPLPGPIKAVVHPHSHGSGSRTVRPSIVSAEASVPCALAAACAAPELRVFWVRKVKSHFASRSDRNGREVFVVVATSGRRRTRDYEAPVGAYSLEVRRAEWGSVILTAPISGLLSKAQKGPGLSEKALKRTKARMPSKPMTRFCFPSATWSRGAPLQMLRRALKGGSFMTRPWRARL